MIKSKKRILSGIVALFMVFSVMVNGTSVYADDVDTAEEQATSSSVEAETVESSENNDEDIVKEESQETETKATEEKTETSDESTDQMTVQEVTEESPKEVSVVLSDLEFVSDTSDGLMHQGEIVTVSLKWDASSYGTDLKEGDYFTVDLPSQLYVSSASLTASTIDLADEDGVVYATAVLDRTNKTLTVTFNSNVEDKYNVNGTIKFRARLSTAETTANEVNTFVASTNGSQTTVDYEVLPRDGWFSDYYILHKNGSLTTWATSWNPDGSSTNITSAMWGVRINTPDDTTYTNVVITDSLTSRDGESTDATYIEESFRLYPVDGFDSYGNVINQGTAIDISDKLVLSEDKKSFTLNLGNISQKYYLRYYTTFDYKAGYSVKNSVELTSNEISKSYTYTQSVASSSGTAEATIANKIKLIKVDADDETVQLADAEFEVTNSDGESFTLTTGSDGTVTSDLLTQGTYTVKETKAPDGYDLNEETFTVDVDDDGVVLTVKDTKTSTSSTTDDPSDSDDTDDSSDTTTTEDTSDSDSTSDSSTSSSDDSSSDESPTTDDTTNVGLGLILILLSISALAGTLAYRKRFL